MIPPRPAYDTTGTFDGAGRTVAVAPTSTIIIAAQDVTENPLFSCYLQNLDAMQTLNAYIETGPSATGPWAKEASMQLDGIIAGETRSMRFDATGAKYVRISGYASGLGLNVKAWGWIGDRKS